MQQGLQGPQKASRTRETATENEPQEANGGTLITAISSVWAGRENQAQQKQRRAAMKISMPQKTVGGQTDTEWEIDTFRG